MNINILENKELLQIRGGLSLTGTLLSYIIKGFNTILELGKTLGSSIRRIKSKSFCSL